MSTAYFGPTLRLLRLQSGLSLKALAEVIGVSSTYLSRIENGFESPPTPDRLAAMARALGLPPLVLVELADRVTPYVARYMDHVPASGALFLDIARRGLSPAQVARVRAFVAEEFPVSGDPVGHRDGLRRLLSVDRVVAGLVCPSFEDAIEIACARLGGPDADAGALARALLGREREATSAIGHGFAVPHATIPRVTPRAALVTLATPVAGPTPDGRPIALVLVLVCAAGASLVPLLLEAARLAQPDVVAALVREPSAGRALAALGAVLGWPPA